MTQNYCAPHAYQLLGDIDGTCRTFALRLGSNSIGSAEGNAIQLEDRSVSRHHAVVHLEPDGLRVEDLSSKNGTFVGDQQIQEKPCQTGDLLRFGGVELELASVDPADLELGLELFGQPKTEPAAAPSRTISMASLRGGETLWLPLVEHVLEVVQPRLTAAPEEALVAICRDLGAGYVALLEERNDWALVASQGELGVLDSRPELLAAAERSRRLRSSEVSFETTLLNDSSSNEDGSPLKPVTCAARWQDDSVRALLIGGHFEGRQRSQFLMATLLRLLAGGDQSTGSSSLQSSAARNESLELDGFVIGPSAAMANVLGQMRALAGGELPALVTGETGTGKELIAAILHRSSPRRQGPFVAINCAAIAVDMMEAELFGVARGAATGVQERAGRFREADGGTLFLDEIGEMPPALQSKLLRALQDKVITPVGGQPQPLDVRLLSATNRDLPTAMDDGTFRRDLYYRLAGFVLHLPPLRRRQGDLPVLLQHFLGRATAEAGKSLRGVSLKALGVLESYAWPGNIRELEHEARRLAIFCPEGGVIDSAMLASHLSDAPAEQDLDELEDLNLETWVEQAELRLIRHVLNKTDGNRSESARLLGISRNGLLAKIRRLGLGD